MVENPRLSEALPQPAESSTDVFDGKTERQKQVLGILEAGIDSILDDQGFAAYLRTLSKFHDYSAQNALLIMMQKPEATKVNSYDRWQQLGRQVQRGEKGIKISFPMFRMQEDPDSKETVRVLAGFGIGNVFDVSQTDGDPLPEPPRITELTEASDVSKEVNLRLSTWLIGEGVRLESKEILGHSRGYYQPTTKPKTIVIRRDVAIDEHDAVVVGNPFAVGKTKTLAHEAGHYVADHRATIPKEDAETVAEAAAFVTMDYFGLDTSNYSFGYIAYWAKDRNVFKRNISEIQRVANAMISAIEGTRPFPAEETQATTRGVA